MHAYDGSELSLRNFVMPLQIGAPDMAFPKLNMVSYWVYFLGGVVDARQLLRAGRRRAVRLDVLSAARRSSRSDGQTMWLIGMVFLITSSLLGSVNFIVTIVQLRAKGLTLDAPAVLRLGAVRHVVPAAARVSAARSGRRAAADGSPRRHELLHAERPRRQRPAAARSAGGGNPLLWQHLFWFLAHPEVYVLILPAMGIVAEVIANNTRKPLWGYRALVYSVIFLGFMSFIVWAHHMFMTGMGTTMSAFFQTTTMIISIPSVVILTALLLSLWGASIRFTTPMLFALAFLPMFGIGGLTGLPLGLAPSDIHLHDTYYVIGHFHYVVAPGTIFALFAGIYYWFPKATGRKMNELLGQDSLLGLVHLHQHRVHADVHPGARRHEPPDVRRRHAVRAQRRAAASGTSSSAWRRGRSALFQLPFIINFFMSIKWGKAVDKNPWEATTLEWSAPSPPGHGNFLTEPVVYRGPYEYSVPGAAKDFTPQFEPETAH